MTFSYNFQCIQLLFVLFEFKKKKNQQTTPLMVLGVVGKTTL